MNPRLRTALFALAALGLLGAIGTYTSWRSEQKRLAEFLATREVERALPGLPDRVRRTNDPLHARMRATRPLVAHYLDPTWIFDVEEEERLGAWEQHLETLGEARDLAAEVMLELPTSWEAPMVYGAATYLLQRSADMSISADQMAEWEIPLRRAEALIPGYLEPTKFLAVAYVNHWQNLSAAQRPEAKETLKRAFRDQKTFNLVVDLWFRLVPDRSEAFSVIPDQAFAWRRLEQIFKRRKLWTLYLDSRERHLELADREVEALLAEAEARVAGGDFDKGTSQFHQIAASLPPGMESLDEIRRVLDRMPAGPVSRAAAKNLRSWLEWTLRLAFLNESPLDSAQLRRLVGAVPDTTLAEEALVALLAGDLAEGERIERRLPGGYDETWGPFLTLKAAALVERGEVEDAQLAVLRVRDSWQSHPTYLKVRRAVAEATGSGGVVDEVARTAEALRRDRWRGSRMRWRDGTARSELVPSVEGSGLTIEFLEAPVQGQPVEIAWNGHTIGVGIIYPGKPLEVNAAVQPEPSLLEIRALDGRPFTPGQIAVLPSKP